MTPAIAFVLFPDFQLLDVAGPVAAFEIAGRHVGRAADIRLVSARGGEVASSAGVKMATRPFEEAGAFDTLLVSGGDGTRRSMACEATLDFVRAGAARARRTASVCSGAFVLAAAGLLDGRSATTHWSRTADFQRRFPKVSLQPDRIFTRDDPVWTSAGITAGIDLALAMVAEDHGEEVARATAQQLVVYHRRPGGQSQFSALVELAGERSRFADLLGWARERLGEALTVERLAERAAMSPRNFARAFAAETGVTPAKAVERLRLEAARDGVESTAAPIEQVARAAGFGDPERMRRAFLRAFGQPPQALRRAARGFAT